MGPGKEDFIVDLGRVGYVGRGGLFLPPQTAAKHRFVDYYKAFRKDRRREFPTGAPPRPHLLSVKFLESCLGWCHECMKIDQDRASRNFSLHQR